MLRNERLPAPRMPNARLLSIELERFKSYEARTKVDLSPLTVVIGRNNSGKSSINQALLLLKQTLEHPRPDVALHLEGPVDALGLGELTFGWPTNGSAGPRIALRWRSEIEVSRQWSEARRPDVLNAIGSALLTSLQEFANAQDAGRPSIAVETTLTLEFRQIEGQVALWSAGLDTAPVGEQQQIAFHFQRSKQDAWQVLFRGDPASHAKVEFDHFLPFVGLDRRSVGPRSRERAWHNAYLLVLKQPLDDLRALLVNLQFLGSTRELPAQLYRPSASSLDTIGVSGERAAHLIHARQRDVVHYLPPVVKTADDNVGETRRVRARPFMDAVNDVLAGLGIATQLSVQDFPNAGFRLLFGSSSLTHVGRGLTYLLPIVELGLFGDPLRFSGDQGEEDLAEYIARCPQPTHLIFEEPESHLHPKVQSRLAEWMVALAMANRQVIVETHSDHLVRRLRGMVARARPGSALESWLTSSVSMIEVDQDTAGRSSIVTSRLTARGQLAEHWPADFMDESTDEESSIYYAALAKSAHDPDVTSGVVHDEGPEPDDVAP